MSNYEHFCSCDTGDELGCRGKGFYDGWGMWLCAVLIHIQRSLFCLIVTVTEILEVELY